MKPKSTLRSFLALAGTSLLAISYAHATPYYWDIDGATPGSGPSTTPIGTWSTGGTTWSTDPLGAIATTAVTTGLTDDLFFSAGTDATGSYTITLSGAQDAKSLTTEDGTVVLSGIINLGGTGNITTRNASTTIGLVDGTVGLTKLGAGKLNLSGSVVHTFTGGLRVNSGTLELTFANFTSGYTDIVNSGNALTIGGGSMIITGDNSANNTSQSFNGVTVNASGGSLLVNPNNAGVSNGTTVNLGSLTATAAGSSLVLGKALSAGTGTVTLTTTNNKVDGIYGPRIVFADGIASTGYNWATTSTVSSPYTLEAYTGYDLTLPTNTGVSTTNYGITAGITLDGNLAANTLKITGSATALALDAFTLTLKSGGLLSVGTVAQTISGTAGGTRLTAGSGLGGSEDLVIHQYNSTTTTATTTGLAITAVIGDNTAGSGNTVNLVKSGINTLALQGLNTYTGNTFINAGTLVIGQPGQGASLAGTLGNGSYAGSISIASGAQFAFRSSSTQTLSGVISGDGSLFKGGNGTLTLSDINTYTGGTIIAPVSASNSGGTLSVSSLNSVGTGPGYAPVASSSLGAPTTVANGTITIGLANLGSTAVLKYTGPGETTDRVLEFRYNGNNTRTVDASGGGLLKFVSPVLASGGTAPGQGTIGLSGNGLGEIAGAIPANGTLGVTKSGDGTWTLSGTNLYTGPTAIGGAGKLFVNGDQTAATGAVTVAATSTLGGTGIIGGNTTIADTGKLEFKLSTAFGSHDKLELAAGKTFTFAGASTLTLTSTGGASTGLYTLVTVPGALSISGTAPATVNVPLGWTYDPPQIVADGLNTSLQINITSTGGGGPGPLDNFLISAISSPQTVGTPITGITLTARDASNATVTSFTGTVNFGGTGGFTGTSATFTAGVLSGVSVTPTNAGSGLTFTVTDLGTGKTGSATITTIQTQYQAWAVGGVAFDADTNGDGVKNGMAFLLGAASPTSAVTLPTVTQSGGNLVLSNFSSRNLASRGTATLSVQHSSDLGIGDPWTTVLVPEATAAEVSGVSYNITPGNPLNTVNTATISVSQSAAGKLFGRLKANQ